LYPRTTPLLYYRVLFALPGHTCRVYRILSNKSSFFHFCNCGYKAQGPGTRCLCTYSWDTGHPIFPTNIRRSCVEVDHFIAKAHASCNSPSPFTTYPPYIPHTHPPPPLLHHPIHHTTQLRQWISHPKPIPAPTTSSTRTPSPNYPSPRIPTGQTNNRTSAP
jgi:hypothetical protein